MREHTAKVKGYGRKAALFSYQQYLKPHSSAGCNCFNKTQGKRVAQDQSCANEISETYSIQRARVLVGIFKIKPSKYICVIASKIVFVL